MSFQTTADDLKLPYAAVVTAFAELRNQGILSWPVKKGPHKVLAGLSEDGPAVYVLIELSATMNICKAPPLH